MPNTTQPSDDFFSLLEKEQKENNSIDFDEIIFRDQSGQMKVLKGGQVFNYNQKSPAIPKTSLPIKPQAKTGILPSENEISKPEISGSEIKPLLKEKEIKTENFFEPINKKSAPEFFSKPLPEPAYSKPQVAPIISFEEQMPSLPALPQMPVMAKRQVILDNSHTQADFQAVAQEIINSCGINLTDADLQKRLRNIIISSVKNIRDRFETKEMLVFSPLEGGVGLPEATAEKIIESSEIKRQEFLNNKPKSALVSTPLQAEAESLLAEVLPEIKPLVTQKIDEPKKPKEKIPSVINEKLPVKEEIIKPVIAEKILIKEEIKIPDFSTLDFSKPKKNISDNSFVKPHISGEVPVNKNQIIITEPVKFTPKLLDPIEEIKTLNLQNFRRLDPDPEKATAKIMKKIELLDQESIVKKMMGITAWKESEPYRLYLKLGLQAMEEKCSMSEIISKKQSLNELTLSEAEVEAIMELNQKLRY